MYNRIQIREIIAWMTLAIALILFSVTFAFAQTKTISVDKGNGKVHLKISKTGNGETVKIDTTFDAFDDTEVDAIIEKLSNSNSSFKTHMNSNKNDGRKRIHIMVDSDFPELSKAEKEKLHKEWKASMKDMRKGIDEMKKSLKNMHIHVDSDSDSDSTGDFHFNFNLPDEEGGEQSDCDGNSYSYKYLHSDNGEVDSLNDKDHVIIIGGDDEKPPVLEKIISSKKGKQIFVYKRSGTAKGSVKRENDKERENQKSKPDIRNLSYYPNPTNGKLKLNFRSDKKGDITIQVLDDNSMEVFSEKLNDFEGEYSREIDLGSKSKGNYFLKIIQGEKSLTKKIILN